MTDIKGEIARRVAHFLCETAMSHKAQIVFEKLNWSEPSHAFFYSLMQEKTLNLALACGIPVIFVDAGGTSAKCSHDGMKLKQGRKEKPPAVKSGGKRRNSWRNIDSKSGLRDRSIRHEFVDKNANKDNGANEFCLSFSCVEAEHAKDSKFVKRGAFCCEEGIVRDHDCVGARNIGLSGEIAREVVSNKFCLSKFEFRRVRRCSSEFHFGWAVLLSATAAVSVSAPVTGSASVSNDVVGLVVDGSPPT
jgi:hypothetical protein